jgi:zinc transporter ZupT
MDVKTKRILTPCILLMIIVGISAPLGDYAAAIMSTSTMAKNAILCQILFLLGIIAGVIMILAVQELNRRYLLIGSNKVSKNNPSPEDES